MATVRPAERRSKMTILGVRRDKAAFSRGRGAENLGFPWKADLICILTNETNLPVVQLVMVQG